MKHQLAGCHLVSVLKHFIGGAFKSLCIPVDEAFQPAVRLDSRKIQNYPFTTATSASDCGERAKHRERERERGRRKRDVETFAYDLYIHEVCNHISI